MKRILILVFALSLGGITHAADKLNVITTTTDLAWITQEVGGDRVAAEAIAKGYQDPHFVEPKPSFLLRLRDADLLVVVGLDLEIGWLPPLLDKSRNDRIRPGNLGYLDVSAGVEVLDRPNGTVDRSMGDVHAMGNPHYWLDPANAIRIAAQVRDRLSRLRPDDAAYFSARYNDLANRLNEAHKKWRARLAAHKNTEVVTYHRSWSNFARRYQLDVVDFVEPKPGVPPSPSHLFQLIRKMKAEKVKVIIVEPYFDLKTPQSVADKTGAKVVVLYPSVGGREGLDSYFDVFDYNINALAAALR